MHIADIANISRIVRKERIPLNNSTYNRQYVVGEDISSGTVYLMYTIAILNVECKSRDVLAFTNLAK